MTLLGNGVSADDLARSQGPESGTANLGRDMEVTCGRPSVPLTAEVTFRMATAPEQPTVHTDS
jgi:hypothetical protein